MVLGAPILIGSSLLPLGSWTISPLLETPDSAEIVFRVDAATFDLDLLDVFLTILERFETFWA